MRSRIIFSFRARRILLVHVRGLVGVVAAGREVERRPQFESHICCCCFRSCLSLSASCLPMILASLAALFSRRMRSASSSAFCLAFAASFNWRARSSSRTSCDGWGCDLLALRRGSGWMFALPRARPPSRGADGSLLDRTPHTPSPRVLARRRRRGDT